MQNFKHKSAVKGTDDGMHVGKSNLTVLQIYDITSLKETAVA